MRALLMVSLLALPGFALAQDKTEKSRPTQWRVIEGQSDQKLAELEARLQALLKEIQALRGGKKVEIAEDKKIIIENKIVPKVEVKDVEKRVVVGAAKDANSKEWKVKPMENLQGRVVWAQEPAHTLTQVYRTVGDDANTIHLTRVTYTLTADKARALESFLKANATAKVLEMKVDGDKLVVTTTPDTQGTIAQVVGLVTGKPVAGATTYRRALTDLIKPALPTAPAIPAPPKTPAPPKPPKPPKPPEKDKVDDEVTK